MKATFKVDQAIKGVSTRTVVVGYVNDDGAMAGWRFAKGSQLIFARRQPDGSLALDYCGMLLYYLRQDQRPIYDGLIRAAASKRS